MLKKRSMLCMGMNSWVVLSPSMKPVNRLLDPEEKEAEAATVAVLGVAITTAEEAGNAVAEVDLIVAGATDCKTDFIKDRL
jgi:hypothetical protein